MRSYARKFGGDEERWAIAGLLHDFDWEICPTPQDHPTYGAQILREHGGFIRAVGLVRPSKSLDDVTPRSVRRKMKDKAFAKDVSREDIQKGADELCIDLDEHIMFIVESMKPIAAQIDLNAGRDVG